MQWNCGLNCSIFGVESRPAAKAPALAHAPHRRIVGRNFHTAAVTYNGSDVYELAAVSRHRMFMSNSVRVAAIGRCPPTTIAVAVGNQDFSSGGGDDNVCKGHPGASCLLVWSLGTLP